MGMALFSSDIIQRPAGGGLKSLSKAAIKMKLLSTRSDIIPVNALFSINFNFAIRVNSFHNDPYILNKALLQINCYKFFSLYKHVLAIRNHCTARLLAHEIFYIPLQYGYGDINPIYVLGGIIEKNSDPYCRFIFFLY